MMPLSRSVSYGLRLSVGAMLTLSSLLILIAISTNQWAIANDNVTYAGIWKTCDLLGCASHTQIIHAKVFLVFFVIINILINLCVLALLWVGEENSKKNIGKACLFNALLGTGGMVSATVFFALASNLSHYLYGFVFGWLGTCLVILCGTVSLIHAALEPDKPEESVVPMFNNNPPPYPGTEAPPSSIIVS